jgi:hypothetical protein
MLSDAHLAAPATPPTNRGVYPHGGSWSQSAFDYARATVLEAHPVMVLDHLQDGLSDLGRPVTRETGAAVKHYSEHVALTDRFGRVLADVFWGGQNGRPNVEAKGSNAVLVVPLLRSLGPHRPSRLDVKRDATAPGLFRQLRTRAGEFAAERDLRIRDIANNHPDRGDTFYLGGRQSQVTWRVYQPCLKRAEEEGRTGDEITPAERDAVRVELEFKPQKDRAKTVASAISPDDAWGVSMWSAELAGEVFSMNVQPISISDRRESDRNRALRFMATQYRSHLESLFNDCQGDVALLGSTLLDLADIPHRH